MVIDYKHYDSGSGNQNDYWVRYLDADTEYISLFWDDSMHYRVNGKTYVFNDGDRLY